MFRTRRIPQPHKTKQNQSVLIAIPTSESNRKEKCKKINEKPSTTHNFIDIFHAHSQYTLHTEYLIASYFFIVVVVGVVHYACAHKRTECIAGYMVSSVSVVNSMHYCCSLVLYLLKTTKHSHIKFTIQMHFADFFSFYFDFNMMFLLHTQISIKFSQSFLKLFFFLRYNFFRCKEPV